MEKMARKILLPLLLISLFCVTGCSNNNPYVFREEDFEELKEFIKYAKLAGEKGFTPGISGNISVRVDDKILIYRYTISLTINERSTKW